MRLRTWSGSYIDSDEGWRRVVLCVVGHLRYAAASMLPKEHHVLVDRIADGVVDAMDRAEVQKRVSG